MNSHEATRRKKYRGKIENGRSAVVVYKRRWDETVVERN
jgi:hypothetical protein